MQTQTPTDHASMRKSALRFDWMSTPSKVSGALNAHVSGSENGLRVATSFGPAPQPTTFNRARPVAFAAPTRTYWPFRERCGRPRSCRNRVASSLRAARSFCRDFCSVGLLALSS